MAITLPLIVPPGNNRNKGSTFAAVLRYIQAKRPRMVMLENVVGLVYKKGTRAENGVVKDLASSSLQNNIRQVVARLESLEYSVATTIIDPSLYRIPQHRLRVWILAIWTPGSPVADFGHAVSQAINHMKVQPLPLANFLLLEGSEDRHYWAEKED